MITEDYQKGYNEGYEYGRDVGRYEMIGNACKWLEDCLPNIEYITNSSIYRQDKSKFIDSFRKEMEEL